VQAISIPSTVYFTGMIAMTNAIDENGVLSEEVAANPYGPKNALKGAVAELKWYADALTAARSEV
jgi:hypothetical protein